MKKTAILNTIECYKSEIDEEINTLLGKQQEIALCEILRYSFGYLDENLKPQENSSGKHFRSGLCLYLADLYRGKEKLLEFASAIEIFHNFTLIHDDIEDHDSLRRGKQTVWMMFGINQAINAGDAQLVLFYEELSKALSKHKEINRSILTYFNQKFLKVINGQFLDFKLAGLPLKNKAVNTEAYFEMISGKTATLIASATEIVGLVLNLGKDETKYLYNFGYNLGMAYQTYDDMASIWADIKRTGKVEKNDLYEKKKTYPIISLYEEISLQDKEILNTIFTQRRKISNEQLDYIYKLFEKHQTQEKTYSKVINYLDSSRSAIGKLAINKNEKEKLSIITEELCPDLRRKS